MVSFSCAQCGDIIKKPKIKTHIMQCWTSGFSCVDCNQQFDTAAVNDHTSCVSEMERYAGKWMEKQQAKKTEKKGGNNAAQQNAAPKRKRSPVRELSSPEWTPEDKPQKAPKRVKKTPSASPAAPPAAAPAKKEKVEKAEKEKKTITVTLDLAGASVPVQLAKKKAKAAKGNADEVKDLVNKALAKLVDDNADAVVAAVGDAL